MPRVWLRSNKYHFLSHWFVLTAVRTRRIESHNLPKREMKAQLIGATVWVSYAHYGSVVMCMYGWLYDCLFDNVIIYMICVLRGIDD